MIKKHQLTILIDAVETGLNVTDACSLSGISRETFYKRLREDAQFNVRFERAQLASKKEAIELIRLAAKKHWQAAAWWLERKYGEEYGLKNQLKVSAGQETIERWKNEMGISESDLRQTVPGDE